MDELGKLVGAGKAQVSNWESGKRAQVKIRFYYYLIMSHSLSHRKFIKIRF